jgi:ABC-2 type transport system ATP-binding protein/lipopolysaccharide transport system ATP-binding protein
LDRVSVQFPVQVASSAAVLRRARGTRADIGSEIVEVAPGRFAVQALKDVTLNLEADDRLAIVGNNGAGKTTLLRTLAGIFEPVTGLREAQGRISTIFAIRLGMEMDLTGIENIILRSLIDGRTRAEIDRKLDEIAEYSGLGDYLHMPLNTYSGGMLARLAFTIATAWGASILLMDEWIGAGDSAFFKMAEDRLVNLVTDVRILVLTSHNPAILKRFCNRAIVLAHGKIVYEGGLDDALEYFQGHQRTRFDAG